MIALLDELADETAIEKVRRVIPWNTQSSAISLFSSTVSVRAVLGLSALTCLVRHKTGMNTGLMGNDGLRWLD